MCSGATDLFLAPCSTARALAKFVGLVETIDRAQGVASQW